MRPAPPYSRGLFAGSSSAGLRCLMRRGRLAEVAGAAWAGRLGTLHSRQRVELSSENDSAALLESASAIREAASQ